MSQKIVMIKAAKAYLKQGLNIVPVKQKKPLVSWLEFQNKKQTEPDFNALPWKNADGFAIIGGSQLKNGKYFCAIDFDVKHLSKEIIDKGIKVLQHLPRTQIEKTPSGGQHWIYHANVKPQTVGIMHNKCAIEILGENKLIIMAPSHQYKVINSLTPTEVDDISTILDEAVKKTGVPSPIEKVTNVENNLTPRTCFSGEDPNCIKKMLRGVSDGQRNECAIRLASYFLNHRKLRAKTAYAKLLNWNKKKNKNPLDQKELETIFKSAAKGSYDYGCEDSILKLFCHSENCPCAKSEAKVPMEKLDAEVERMLSSQNPILEIEKHLDNVIAGEKENKIAIFILLLSGKFNDPTMKQMILLKGTEGSGKSTLMQIADFFKTKDVGRFSAHALDYSDLADFEILRLKELGNMDEEAQGVSTIKFLSSDDKGYTVEVTTRDDETGYFIAKPHRIPAITLISSTTRVYIDRQYQRRNWIFNPDESIEQTRKILEWKAKNVQELSDVLLGIKESTSYEYSKSVLNHLVKSLKPSKVIIPFPHALTTLCNPDILRSRGDYDKISAFIRLYCLPNQRRLPSKENSGARIVVATPEICLEALRIVQQPLASMALGLERRSQDLIEVLKGMSIDSAGDEIRKGDRDKIAQIMNKSERTVRSLFSEWEAAGYVSSDEKKPKTYKLLFSLDDIEKKNCAFSAELESANSLFDKMEKEAQEWLRSLRENGNLWMSEIYPVRSLCTIPTSVNINAPTIQKSVGESSPTVSTQSDITVQVET
jgi:hypothetical protein